MGAESKKDNALEVVEDVRGFFKEILREAFEECKVVPHPTVSLYLTDILQHYMFANNLFVENAETGKKMRQTLAETFLLASQAPPAKRIELLKRLGDFSLYISGFFGDSLHRKLVDVDYYREMGGAAYQSLSTTVREADFSYLFLDISKKFTVYTDVFSVISEKSMATEDESREVFVLYEKFLKTGSDRAKMRLIEKGVLVSSFEPSPGDEQ